MDGTQDLAIAYRLISDLIPYARNARTHSEAQVALIAGSILSYMDGRMEALGIGMGIACLCVLAAIGTHSRVSAGNLTIPQRLEILRTLLERDLISADEFGVFEQRIIGAH